MLTSFPNWNSGRTIDIQKTSITNVFPRVGLRRIEIATLIRKGNSGGPLIDNYFRLLEVSQKGALQNKGNNESLYAEELDQWLDSLKISFQA
jgi:RNA-directed DNA polymerase